MVYMRRVVFGHDDWARHESSGRYFRHLRTMFRSSVIAALALPVGVITSLACVVVAWNGLVLAGRLPPQASILLHFSDVPLSLTAPALAFLLVFRTNSAYDRFVEARKIWGLMLSRMRDICRQALTYIARDGDRRELPKRAQFLRHLQAFPLAFKHHLVREGSLEEDLKEGTSLSEEEVRRIARCTHKPNFCLQVMSECVGKCRMDPAARLAMEKNFATFAEDVGGCERIFKTPIPLEYTRLTSRFLILYHLFLPFALYDHLGWLTIPVIFVHSGIFFCIDEVGVVIENPFPALALDAIAQSANSSIVELESLHDQACKEIVKDAAQACDCSQGHSRSHLDRHGTVVIVA